MKIRCPHCDKPAPLRIEGGDGEFRQTVQCAGCRQIYRVAVRCEAGAVQARCSRLD